MPKRSPFETLTRQDRQAAFLLRQAKPYEQRTEAEQAAVISMMKGLSRLGLREMVSSSDDE